jgi:hypothetical protein
MPWGDVALLVASAFAIAVVFCAVFGAAAFLLWKMLAPKDPRRSDAEADEPGPLLSMALPFSAGDVFESLWIVWLVVIGLLVLLAVWTFIGPWVLHRFPRLSNFLDGLLPLPCQHRDRHGHSLMYRERRALHGHDVPHWVCPKCSTAIPIIGRSIEDLEGIAAVGAPAFQSMRAEPFVDDEPLPATERGR